MTPAELKKVHMEVATLCGLIEKVDVEGALAEMESVRKSAQVLEPIIWAQTKDTHIRMTALMEATLTYQRTVNNIREVVVADHKPASPFILPA